MGLGEIVSFPGRIDYSDARRWLSLGEVAVSFKSSLTEANGKLLNYMACGLPIVASDTSVNRELLGDQGLYVPLDSIDDIATKIIEVLSDRDRARAIGESLRRRVEQRYSWSALAVRLEKIYRETLGNYPGI
jgi:glycosyltransferase involved in cell wall biosynthesis